MEDVISMISVLWPGEECCGNEADLAGPGMNGDQKLLYTNAPKSVGVDGTV